MTDQKYEHPVSRGLDRAVALARNGDCLQEGPCPSCGETVTVSVDTLYDRKTGRCESCGQGVAYHAPDGTYRTDVRDPAPGVWRVDIRHYCSDCRYEIPLCWCPNPAEVPPDYAETSRHPWEPPRDFSEARSAGPQTTWELESTEDGRYRLTVRVKPARVCHPYVWRGNLSVTAWGRCSLDEMRLESGPRRRTPVTGHVMTQYLVKDARDPANALRLVAAACRNASIDADEQEAERARSRREALGEIRRILAAGPQKLEGGCRR